MPSSSSNTGEVLFSQIARASHFATCIAFMYCFLLTGCGGAQAPSPPSSSGTTETETLRAQLSSDAAFWIEVVKEVHPAPFAFASETEVTETIERSIAKLPPNPDPMEIVLSLSTGASLLRDSHTYFDYPEESAAYGERLFRYLTRVEGDGLFLDTQALSPGIPSGARLLSINGLSGDRIVSELRSIASGELDRGRDIDAVYAIPYVLWAKNVRAPFSVAWARTGQARTTSSVPGKLKKTKNNDGSSISPEFSFRRIAERFGYIDIRGMSDADEFFASARDAFNEIAEDEPDALIIDLRANGGGTTEAGDILISLISNKPYRMIGAKHWKVSSRYKKVIAKNYDPVPEEYMKAQAGAILKLEGTPTVPTDYGYRYLGPVCVLIGPHTASAAMMLANAIQDYDLATMIGEPTASPPNYFGETYEFNLPGTGISATTSVAYFVRANGDPADRNPVLPDILVRDSESDGSDAVLDAAIEWATIESDAAQAADP